MRLFETRTVKDSDGNCTDHIWCGYCSCCQLLFKNSPYDDIEEWRKVQWLYAKKQDKRKIELERAALLEICDNIPHYFITCTFDENKTTPKEVEKILNKIQESHDLDGGIASIEYYSDKNEEGGHLHFHLLAPKAKKYKPSVILDYVQKHTKLERNFIDLEQEYTNTFTKRVEYICGVKQANKLLHIEKDREWRAKHGFPHVYVRFTESLRIKYKKEINYALRC